MTDISKLASVLAKARKARAWSQKQLADRLEMKQSQISDIESGKRDLRVTTLVEIARALGFDLVLVPHATLPAVQYLLQADEPADREEETAIYGSWREEDE